jgi:signal peptide peptidase SppA
MNKKIYEIVPGVKNTFQGVINTPLLIKPEVITEILSHSAGLNDRLSAISDFERHLTTLVSTVENNVAIVEIRGIICNRGNIFSVLWGFCPTDFIKGIIESHLKNIEIKRIILNIDSPGGMVDGVETLSNFIFESRQIKDIVAIANPLAASAAYWIGSAANKIYSASQTSAGGSIGVIAIHQDFSEMHKDIGLKITEITSAKFKAVTSSNNPLPKEGEQELLRQVMQVHDVFVSQVARNMGIEEKKVLDDGRIYLGQDAVNKGIFDGIKTLDELILETNMDKNDDNKTVKTPDMPPIVPKEPETPKAETNQDTITFEIVKRDRPEIYKNISGEGKKEGMKVERERIQGIEKATPKGFEKFAEQYKFDGKTTPEQYALKVAEKIAENGITQDMLETESYDTDFAGETGEEITGKTLSKWIAKGMAAKPTATV